LVGITRPGPDPGPLPANGRRVWWTERPRIRSGALRVRVGDSRVVYRIEDGRLVVVVVRVGVRGAVYG